MALPSPFLMYHNTHGRDIQWFSYYYRISTHGSPSLCTMVHTSITDSCILLLEYEMSQVYHGTSVQDKLRYTTTRFFNYMWCVLVPAHPMTNQTVPLIHPDQKIHDQDTKTFPK